MESAHPQLVTLVQETFDSDTLIDEFKLDVTDESEVLFSFNITRDTDVVSMFDTLITDPFYTAAFVHLVKDGKPVIEVHDFVTGQTHEELTPDDLAAMTGLVLGEPGTLIIELNPLADSEGDDDDDG